MTHPAQQVIGFATTNPHKLEETQACISMLAPGIRVVPVVPREDVDETGETFCQNARIKLEAALSAGAIPPEATHVIAEDAGLIVDALDGRYGLSPFPGIRSDRWFSPQVQTALFGRTWDNPTYAEKNQGILKLLEGVSNRAARYEACIACWDRKTGDIFFETGTVSLAVATAPRGSNGFGYDPIMIPVAYDPHRTMAELSATEKNRISHRYHALRQVLERIGAAGLAPHTEASC